MEVEIEGEKGGGNRRGNREVTVVGSVREIEGRVRGNRGENKV